MSNICIIDEWYNPYTDIKIRQPASHNISGNLFTWPEILAEKEENKDAIENIFMLKDGKYSYPNVEANPYPRNTDDDLLGIKNMKKLVNKQLFIHLRPPEDYQGSHDQWLYNWLEENGTQITEPESAVEVNLIDNVINYTAVLMPKIIKGNKIGQNQWAIFLCSPAAFARMKIGYSNHPKLWFRVTSDKIPKYLKDKIDENKSTS